MPDRRIFDDEDLDRAARIVLGRSVHGTCEVGEVLATLARVGHRSDWTTQWSLTARVADKQGRDAQAAGHLATARSAFLRSVTYWGCAVDGHGPAEPDAALDAFHAQRSAWDAFIDCSEGAHLRLRVPYEDDSLPGYLLRPDASGRVRPTLVITQDGRGPAADVWLPALQRGWNAVVYDGPGQQSMLFERGLPLRPDWQHVLTPVLDMVVAHESIDASRLAAYAAGTSSHLLLRALTIEHRITAAVVDPGVVDLTAGTGTRGQDRRLQRSRLGPEEAARITTSLLATESEQEDLWPGQSRRLARLVPHTEVVGFTAAQGAEGHSQPLGRLLTENTVLDWLEDRVPG